ncbi:hypothetical protein AMELA_G00082880 [Ameiurus melas]|uniref:Uncharacterized protein n=1 Tax=Ameiurus melas TaxID=219545 RepID=A0A7J6B243_AMEME|nr:hypothetical protein AMELA_G00082880 [Ameiurus melas]
MKAFTRSPTLVPAHLVYVGAGEEILQDQQGILRCFHIHTPLHVADCWDHYHHPSHCLRIITGKKTENWH